MNRKNDALMWLEQKKFVSSGVKNLITLLLLLGLGTACTLSRLLDPDIALTSICLLTTLMFSNKAVISFYDAALKQVLCIKRDMRHVVMSKLIFPGVVTVTYIVLQSLILVLIMALQNRFDPMVILRALLCLAEMPVLLAGVTVISLSVKAGFRTFVIIGTVLLVNVLLMAEKFSLLFLGAEVLFFTGLFLAAKYMISKLTVEEIFTNGGRR
jgi:hypothetical protein